MSVADASAPPLTTRMVAEAFGTLLLVFAGIGTVLFAGRLSVEDDATGPVTTVGLLGVALAFGLAVMAAMAAWGPISGGHFNPATTLAAALTGRLSWKDACSYAVAQVVGALVATTLLVLVGLFGPSGWLSRVQNAGFASSGFGDRSPGSWAPGAAIVLEVLLTCVLVLVFLAATGPGRSVRQAAPVVGLAMAMVYLVSLQVDGGGANPARSIATALYGGVIALAQLWVFVIFPLVGALIAGLVHRALLAPHLPRR